MIITSARDVVAVLAEMRGPSDLILAVDVSGAIHRIGRVTRPAFFATQVWRSLTWMEVVKGCGTPLQRTLLGRNFCTYELKATSGPNGEFVRQALDLLEGRLTEESPIHPVAQAIYDQMTRYVV